MFYRLGRLLNLLGKKNEALEALILFKFFLIILVINIAKKLIQKKNI